MHDSARSPFTPSTFGWNRASSSQLPTFSIVAESATNPAIPVPDAHSVSVRKSGAELDRSKKHGQDTMVPMFRDEGSGLGVHEVKIHRLGRHDLKGVQSNLGSE